MIHQLKQAFNYFEDVTSGRKTFEVRKNDRDFKAGDFLGLNELNTDGKETGRFALFRISYVLDAPEYCKEGYVVLGIQPCTLSIVHGAAPVFDQDDPALAGFRGAVESLQKVGEKLNVGKQ